MPGVRGMRPMGRRCAALASGWGGYAVRPTSFAAGCRFIRCGRGGCGRGFRNRWYHRAYFCARICVETAPRGACGSAVGVLIQNRAPDDGQHHEGARKSTHLR